MYVLSALAEVESADDRFLSKVTGLSLEEIRDVIRKLEAGEFVTAGGKDGIDYVSLTNLGRSTFGYYWKRLKRCPK